MNRTRFSMAALLLGSMLLPSCSLFKQEHRETEAERQANLQKAPPPLHLGAVHQVFPEKHFALLRIIGPVPAEGTVLITHPPDGATDRIGNLCVSSAQNAHSNIIAADIRSGTVIKGDRVYLYRSVAVQPEARDDEGNPTGESAGSGETAGEATDPAQPEPATLPQPPAGRADAAAATTPATTTADVPSPAPEPTNSVETTVVPEQDKLDQDPENKALIDDVPDSINGWN